MQAGLLRGTTLWLDFPFPAFPENMVGAGLRLTCLTAVCATHRSAARRPPMGECKPADLRAHAAGRFWIRSPQACADRQTLITAIPLLQGHWAEVLAPVYSALTEGAWKERAPEGDGHISALLFPNLRRKQVQVRPCCGAGLALGRAC